MRPHPGAVVSSVEDEPLPRPATQPPEAQARRWPVWVLAAAIAGLAAAWVLSTPPGAGPDEMSHFLRALSISQGHLLGSRPAAVDPALWGAPGMQLTPAEARYYRDTSVLVSVPPGMDSTHLACERFEPTVPATCEATALLNRSTVTRLIYDATLQPISYLPAAAAVLAAGDARTGTLLGRAASAIVTVGLLALALLVLFGSSGAGLPAIGLMLGMTPAVLSNISMLNPSGVEIASAACFAACLLRLGRDGEAPSRLVWVALASSAFLLLVTRLGPIWFVLDIVLLASFSGWRRVALRVRQARVAAYVAGGACVAAAAVDTAWWLAIPHPPSHLGIASAVAEIWPSAWHVPDQLRQQVGVFGWLDTSLPLRAVLVWAACVAALVVVAFVVGRRRQQLVLIASLLVAAVLFVVYGAVIGLQIGVPGVGQQGRHLLPYTVVLPMLGGEVLWRNRSRLPAAPAVLAIGAAVVVTGAVQAWALLVNGQRYAVGTTGPTLFFRNPAWSPPGGWIPVILAALVCGAAWSVAGIVLTRGGLRVSAAAGSPAG